jgi:type II secretory pathway pseudopilin PulG
MLQDHYAILAPHNKKQRGFLLISTLVFAGIAVLLITAVISGAQSIVKYSRSAHEKELAFQIAEAGVEYYRWHLAHNKNDFMDGTGVAGPYTHTFVDKDGTTIGNFRLTITPPPSGSTVVTILSEGILSANPSVIRAVRVRLAVPSLAKFAVASNSSIRFGEGTEVFGPIHSNGGVRFDGLAHNIVSSAVASYNDPDHAGNGGNQEFGVHTHVKVPPDTGVDENFINAESPPSIVQTRSDVFLAGRQFPVPAVDFAGITTDLATMKAVAQSGGKYYAPSGALGYHVVFKTNDTFDLYKVTSLIAIPNGCTSVVGQQDWGTWSISNQTLLGNYPNPGNGVIFIEDNAWVDGKINTARVTVGAGRFPDSPGQRKSIAVNDNLLYTNYDGQDAIALVAQQDISAGLRSADTLRIDGALVAQYGRIGRFYYRPATGHQSRCAPYDVRNTITLYGMLATAERYGFAYEDGTGYQNRIIIYDNNLLYGPPPSFPLTSDQYQVISWEIVK